MSTYYDINESLFDQIMESMLDQLPSDMDKREGGVAYTLLAPMAMEMEKLYQDLDATEQASFLIDENGELSAYGSYVDRRVNEFGVLRKPGGSSTATITVTATPATLVPAFTEVATESATDQQLFETQADVWATPEGAIVEVKSLEASASANTAEGEIVAINGDLAGTVSITASTAATGGFDEEDDETLVKRFLSYQRRQTTSGNPGHYAQWATEVAGIAKARVIPVWDGPGTVKVTLIGADGGEPTPMKVAEVADYIESQRPIGANVTVVPADALAINVTATVVLMASADEGVVIDDFKRELANYFIDVDSGDSVTPTRVGGLLVGLPDVIDYGGLTLNGGTTPVTLTGDQVAVIGEVTLNAE